MQRHVFVIHGKIGSLTTDADIVSTDADFTVEPHWHELLGGGRPFDAARFRPRDWVSTGWGRSADGSNRWFVDVTGAATGGTDRFDRLRQALEEVGRALAAEPSSRRVTGRPVPLVAVPVIGVGAGGHGEARGNAVARLIEVCESFDGDGNTVDIAIVTPNPATYGALQQQRRDDFDQHFATIDIEEAKRLGERARKGTLALFIGAGASMPSGAPSWSGLLEELASGMEDLDQKAFRKLGFLDQAELLASRMGTPGQDDGPEKLSVAVADRINGKAPSLAHTLLAALGCREAVTTNYDDLYENAIKASGRAAARLPTELAAGDQPWILKLHGDLSRSDSLVLTRHQFVTFTALSGPSGAILQSLLLTRHLLVVGASMNDDNVLRLIHEVLGYRRSNDVQPKRDDPDAMLGTVLDVSGDTVRSELHRDHFHWLTLPGDEIENRARALEILLDAMGVYAGTEQTWLLDPRFSDLHQQGHRDLVDRATALYDRIVETAGEKSRWTPMLKVLRRAGVPRSNGASDPGL